MPPGHKRLSVKFIEKILLFSLLTLIVLALVWWRRDDADKAQQSNKPTAVQQKKSTGSSNSLPEFNKKQYSVNDPASLWVVVNKGRVLPSDYVPQPLVSNLRQDASVALKSLIEGASANGFSLRLYSGYRSYSNQASVYANEVKTNGQVTADRQSARPGYSEHQTGLAADLSAAGGKCTLQQCFGDMAEGQWLATNAYKYGFIIRYPKDKEALTGYMYEPWHLRYVGTDLAAEINKSGQTLEQFFDLSTYTDYPSQKYKLGIGN